MPHSPNVIDVDGKGTFEQRRTSVNKDGDSTNRTRGQDGCALYMYSAYNGTSENTRERVTDQERTVDLRPHVW